MLGSELLGRRMSVARESAMASIDPITLEVMRNIGRDNCREVLLVDDAEISNLLSGIVEETGLPERVLLELFVEDILTALFGVDMEAS